MKKREHISKPRDERANTRRYRWSLNQNRASNNYISANREEKSSVMDISAIAPRDRIARAWKTRKRDVIGQRAIRRIRARRSTLRGAGKRRDIVARACAVRCRRLYRTWPPRAWYRQRCAKNDGFSALLTARSYVRAREQCRASVSAASRGRDGATAVPHHHGVGHRAAFPERVQFPAEFGEFSRASSSSSRARTPARRAVGVSIVGEPPPSIALHRRSGVASDTRLLAVWLGSPQLDRRLPYLAVHWQPCEKANREREFSELPLSRLLRRGRESRSPVRGKRAETKGLGRVNKRR